MATRKFWKFNSGGVPTELLQRTNGNGSVSVTNGRLVLDTGGSAATDCAAVVYDTAVDLSKYTVCAAAISVTGPVMGAHSMNIMGLYDSSSAPAIMTNSTRGGAEVIWCEDQYSTSNNFERWELKYNNPSGTVYYGRTDESWSTTFGSSITEMHRDSLYVLIMIIDGPNDRVRFDVLGRTDDPGDNEGYRLNYCSQWATFGTGGSNIDEVNNSAWLVLGDLVNDKSAGYDIQYEFDWLMIGTVEDADQFAWTNVSAYSTFPFPYNIWSYVNPCPDDIALWIPVDRRTDSIVIDRGSNDWVKDPSVFDNTADDGKYYMAYNLKAAGGDCSIYICEATSLFGSWTNHTQVVTTGAGEAKAEFPFLTRKSASGDWVLFYDVEDDTPEWRIYVRTSSNSTPYSGWSSATELLDTTGSTSFDDDGCAQPTPVWWSGTFDAGTWIMYYAGYNGSVWAGHYAVSTTGFDGTYTKGSGGPDLNYSLFATETSGTGQRTTTVNVDSTSGLTAGDIIFLDGANVTVPVTTVESSTQITVPVELSYADNDDVIRVNSYSVAPRSVRKINGVWHAWVTAFKYPFVNTSQGNEEYVFLYVDTASAADPRNATWRAVRETDDYLYTFTLPVVTQDRTTQLSNENIGFAFGLLEAAINEYSLTAAQGSYTLSGQSSSLLAGRLLAAAQGSYTLSGQDIALIRGYTLAALHGAYNVLAPHTGSPAGLTLLLTKTGQDVDLLVGRSMGAAQGGYTLSGQDAGLLAGRLIAAVQGTYTLTGQDAALLVSRLMGASQGAYTLSGQDASLLVGRILGAAQGGYTLSGQDAGLLADRLIAAAQGSYTLTGQDAALLLGYLVSAAQGSYTLSGQDVGLLVNRLLSAAQGDYTLAGQDVTLTYTPAGVYTLTAAQGSYTLAGQPAVLLAHRILTGEYSTYTLTGQDVGLTYGRVVLAGQGDYTLSGQGVGLTADRILAAAQGSQTLSGQDASLLVGRIIAAAQGDYTLSGQDAGLLADRIINAAQGSYTLSGRPVTLVWSGEEAAVTPDTRIFVVQSDDRTYIVVADSRTFDVPAETRTIAAM